VVEEVELDAPVLGVGRAVGRGILREVLAAAVRDETDTARGYRYAALEA